MAFHQLKLPIKVILYSGLLYLFVFFVFLLLSFFFDVPFSLAWGWILGAFISNLTYGLIMLQASRLQARVQAKITTPYRGQGYTMARYALSGAGMLLSVFVKINDQEVFNLFTVFAAYLVISIVIYVSGAQVKMTRNPS